MSNTSRVSGLEEAPDVVRRYFVLDADREIESIVARLRGRKYGLRSLIHEIVQSRMFREK